MDDPATSSRSDAMTTASQHRQKTLTLVGAGIGLVAFLAVALLPSLLYGGYAGVLLAGSVLGTPVGTSLGVKALIVVGMVLGVTATAGFFSAVGAAGGAAIGVLTRGVAGRKTEVDPHIS
jgi:hypothetical protein